MNTPTQMHITFEPEWWKVENDDEPYYKTAILSTGDDIQFNCPCKIESNVQYPWEDAPNDLKDKWSDDLQLYYHNEATLLRMCTNRDAETTTRTIKTTSTYKVDGLICAVSSEIPLEGGE